MDRQTHLDVYFHPKSGKHGKLKNSQHAEEIKKYWGKQLDQLANFLIS